MLAKALIGVPVQMGQERGKMHRLQTKAILRRKANYDLKSTLYAWILRLRVIMIKRVRERYRDE